MRLVVSNEQFIRNLYHELVNARNIDAVDELMAEDYVEHGPMGDLDRDGFKEAIAAWLTAIPDVRAEIDVLFSAGDRVGYVEHVTGTHTGEMMGIPPSGRRIDLRIPAIARIRDGRAVEHWSDQSLFQFMSQIGAIPAPGAAA